MNITDIIELSPFLFTPMLAVGLYIFYKHGKHATSVQKAFAVCCVYGVATIFVAAILLSGFRIFVYYNDIQKIESLTTQVMGTIVDYEDAWPKEGTNWGETSKTKSGFTLTITLDDGKKYGFDVEQQELVGEIDIADKVRFYYSEDIYPNTGFNAFGLERDGVQLSNKISNGLRKAFNESKWYAVFSLLIGGIYGYQCFKQRKLLHTLGWKEYMDCSYHKINK